MPNPDECPHCTILGEGVIHLAFQVWRCLTCECSFHELAIDNLHYWINNGEAHIRPDVDELCEMLVPPRQGSPHE